MLNEECTENQYDRNFPTLVQILLGVKRSTVCSWAVYHCLESSRAIHSKQRGRGKTKGTQLALHVTKHKPNKSPETNWEQERGEMRTTWPWISFLRRGIRVYFHHSHQQPCVTASRRRIYSLATPRWYCYGLFSKIVFFCNLSWFMVKLIAWPCAWESACMCESVQIVPFLQI